MYEEDFIDQTPISSSGEAMYYYGAGGPPSQFATAQHTAPFQDYPSLDDPMLAILPGEILSDPLLQQDRVCQVRSPVALPLDGYSDTRNHPK